MKAFVNDEDYKVVIGERALKVLSQTDEANRRKAEITAIEEISGYLRHKYDCAAIFSAEGDERNPLIIMYACDIALYHMSSSAPGRMEADTRKERYDDAIKWLTRVQSGDIIPNLPLIQDEDTGTTGIPLLCGSEVKIDTIW